MKKLLALLLCLVISLSALAACDGNNTETTTNTTNNDTEQTVKYPIEVDYFYELTQPSSDPASIANVSSANFSIKTDKKPYEYKVGEDVVFSVSLMSGAKVVSCEKFHVTLKYDGIEEIEDFYISGETGQFDLTTQIAQPGYMMINVEACDASNKPYSKADVVYGGAGAQIEELVPTAEEPADFDEYWQNHINELLKIDPEIIQFEKYESTDTYDFYNLKVLAVDDGAFFAAKGDNDRHDYASGIVAVPKNAAANSCKLLVQFDGHGIYAGGISSYLLDGKTICVKIIAHSIEARLTQAQIDKYKFNVIGNYGIDCQNETDPDNIYFKNLLLRDLQAVRFLKEYFGEGGEGAGIWNGADFHIHGGSQGGFQAAAVAALADQVGVNVTYAKLSSAWLCDIAGNCTEDSVLIDSNFWPKGDPAVLSYFDSVFFGRRIKCKVDVNVGLGDFTTTPTSVTKLYFAIPATEKTFTLIQNKNHGTENQIHKTYKYTTE